MKNILLDIINLGVDASISRVKKTRLQVFNISCLLGVTIPLFTLIPYLFGDTENTFSYIIIATLSALSYGVAIYMNSRKLHYISSLIIPFVSLFSCLAIIRIVGNTIRYDYIILIMTISPFLHPYKKKWHIFFYFFIFLSSFIALFFVPLNPSVQFNTSEINYINFFVQITAALLAFYLAIALYYIHEVAISDIKEQARETLVAKEKAEENDRLKSAFLANISHEIRTPMNSIIGFAEQINQVEVEESEIRRYTAIINESSQQLLRIVNDVLDISKIETGQMNINPTPVSIINFLQQLHQVFRATAEEKNLQLHLRCNIPEEDAMISIDVVKLQQILTNFLSNAVKYTKKGTIELGCELSTNRILFHVKDQGIGIAPEHQQLIFERFHQIDDEHNKGRGTGLGLAISRGFAELLKGKVWVNSKLGEGSTFYLELPYQKASLPAPPPISINDQSKSLNHLSDKRILIAEDEIFNYKLLEVIFKQWEIEIVWAKNGQQAIEMINAQNNFDLVLMDIKMPVLGGLEATKIIKAQHPNLPIIAQSAFAFMDEKERSLQAGCDYYITKPIRKKELLKLLQISMG